jgi:phosphatidate cytidylyltransferase
VIDRIKTAAVALPLLLAVLFFGGTVGLAALAAAAAVVGMREFLNLLPLAERPSEDLFTVLWSGMVALSFALPEPAAPAAALAVGALVLFLLVSRRDPDAEGVRRIGRALAGWLYVGFFLGHAVVVRSYGELPIFFLIALVMVGDSAAYFVGTALGRHRLAPRVSPKKSVEGTVGGFVFTVAAAAGLSAWVDLPHGALAGALIGAAVNIAAQAGDLLESYLKRGAGVKDSGGMFPGHGGMLDRIDSLLPALPIYALSLSLVVRP